MIKSRGIFSRTSPTHTVISLSNRLLAKEPFEIPYDQLNISHKKKYRVGGGTRTQSQSRLLWIPQAKVEIDFKTTTWIPELCKSVLREKYPVYHDPRTDVFTLKTSYGNTFPQSTEHLIENLIHILWYANKIATRNPDRFHYDHHYLKFRLPLIFRYKENQWLDFKRMDNAVKLWSAFKEPHGSGESFRQLGGYQPINGPMKGQPYYQKMVGNEYNPNANYKMDPFGIDPAAAERKLGGNGVRWYR
eukprot:TRINITY_DN1057_c0_g1_i2.p1 TRINITY_DN1057_c0_g1~~TRINITY_DN1057_c0_g1_i2.p1  ORF type:complete len:246 (+),score=5.89 TRINITY_DN1057_c0_g1_i2:1167-1904(+)